jgi:cytoskeletal protein RodZ
MLEIGGSLRQARARAGLELPDIEAATMIPARYLDAIETERFEVLPVGPYRRSFLREYADYLGLRGDVYADEYRLRYEPPEPEPDPEPASSAAARHVSRALDEITLRRAVVVVAFLVAAIAVWRLGTGGGSGVGASPPPRAQTVAATPSAAHHSAPPPVKPAPPQPETAHVRPALTLQAARGDCWLAVRTGSPSGPVVYQGVLRAGQTARFGLRKTLWLRLGAPWNLDASIGRRSVTSDLPDRTGNAQATAHGIGTA